MDLLILFYIFGGCLFVFLLYTLEPRGYYWGQIRGYENGLNNLQIAKKMIQQDIARSRKEVLVASCAADLCLWDEDIVKKIREKSDKEYGKSA